MKQLTLSNISKGQMIIIGPKRFDPISGAKIQDLLNFPLKFTRSFDGGKTNVTATLVSSVEHSGVAGGGHYIAKCKTKRGWYLFNDLHQGLAQKLSPQEVLRVPQNSYELYYVVTNVSSA